MYFLSLLASSRFDSGQKSLKLSNNVDVSLRMNIEFSKVKMGITFHNIFTGMDLITTRKTKDETF